MKTFMMTTAIVALTSFGALAQTAGTTGQTTATQQQQQQMDQQRVPAFLASDFIGKNVYTVDVDDARALRDQRMGVGTQPAMQQQPVQQQQAQQQQPVQQQPGAADVQQLELRVQQLQQEVQQLQAAGTDQQQVQQLEQEVQQLQAQVQQLQGQEDQQQLQQVDQQVQQIEQRVAQLQQQTGQQVQQQQAATQPQAQPGAQPGIHPQAQHRGTWDQTRLRWETGDTFIAARDRWNNVGDIDDVVMTADGEIRGILIDVGGFLGIGARTVMVDIDELHFVLDQEPGATGGWFDDTADAFFIVAAMTEAELEALPEWDEANLRAGFDYRAQQTGTMMRQDDQIAREGVVTQDTAAVQQQQQVDPAAQQQQQQVQPQMARTEPPAGHDMVAHEQLTVDNLIGANVYDGQNQQIGNVEDLVLAADGTTIEAIVLDVGGFLGIGQHRVALQIQEVDIFMDQQNQEVRVQVPHTQEQLEQMPEHQI